ncbi:MAG: cellulase family glycosylhydrolase [Chitinispirillales bacterium]|jgi:endoglucanase|nr:cellulase family glycosylhydrolase [Chitinispirillales bacterium]
MRRTKHFLPLTMLLVFMFAGVLLAQLPAPGWAPTGSPVADYGQLKVVGRNIVSEKTNQPVTLRGVSFGWSSNTDHERPYYTKRVVGWLAYDWKVTLVRAALGVSDKPPHGAHQGPGTMYSGTNDGNAQAVERVIEAAIEQGIYVIVDWHSHNAHSELDGTNGASEFFRYISGKYKGYPNIIYEIYNEPLCSSWGCSDGGACWNTIRTYANRVISTIRQNDPNNIIVVGTPYYSQCTGDAMNNQISGTNIMYTLHFYCNHNFSDRLSANLPIFVTEFGLSNADGNNWCGSAPTVGGSYMSSWFDAMESNNRSWAIWQVSTRNESSALLKSVTAQSTDQARLTNGNWTANDLSSGGTFIRDKLRRANTRPDRTFTITLDKIGDGAVSGGGAKTFCQTYTLSATPGSGMRLEGWIVNGGPGGSTNPLNGEACSEMSATAVFFPTNMIAAGFSTFTTGSLGQWSVKTASGGAGSVIINNMEAAISATNYGTARNSVRLEYPTSSGQSLTLTQGQRYRLEFRAKSIGADRKITPVVLERNNRLNDTASVQLITEMRDYWMEFDMTAATVTTNAFLSFYYGNEQGSWVIDDINLRSIGAATSQGTTGNYRDPVSVSHAAARAVPFRAVFNGKAFVLAGSMGQRAEVQVFDMAGRVRFTKNVTLSGGSAKVSLDRLPAGIYTVRYKLDGKAFGHERVMLER